MSSVFELTSLRGAKTTSSSPNINGVVDNKVKLKPRLQGTFIRRMFRPGGRSKQLPYTPTNHLFII